METRLVFVLPGGQTQSIPLSAHDAQRKEVSIGRAPENTVELDHPAVSRRHLRLTAVDGPEGWMAEDTGSANGTLHNGEPLGSPPIRLLDGDCLAFGPGAAAIRAVFLSDTGLGATPTPDTQEPPFPAPGTTLAGRYKLVETLGETSEFENYRAADIQTEGAWTSLKVFRPTDGFPALVARVDRLRAAPSHPNVIRVWDARRVEGWPFVVSRWVEGFSVLDLLRTRAALTLPEALSLLGPAAAASDHVAEHAQGALDLEPRPTLLAFNPPLDSSAWEALRREPLERWPAFTARFAVSLLAPVPSLEGRVAALARFAGELLGQPRSDAAGGRGRPARIIHPALGEAGNEVLGRALTPDPASLPTFASGREFVEALARAANLNPALAVEN